jgi:serine/threonine protein kinase
LTREWRVKIADFGLSQLKNKTKGTIDPKVATGGTPLYMPPEMFKLKPEISEKCDVYAFGVSTETKTLKNSRILQQNYVFSIV